MEKFTKLTSVAAPLPMINIDTDKIIPKNYLKTIKRTGLGKALFQHLGALAVERGCGRFEWSVLDWNENAIRFYEKMGATVMPDWRICRVAGPALASFGPKD